VHAGDDSMFIGRLCCHKCNRDCCEVRLARCPAITAAACCILQVPFFPPLQSSDSFTTDVCRQLLAEAIGTANSKSESLLADLEIHSIRPWTMHAEVAQHMRQVEDSSRCIRIHLAVRAAFKVFVCFLSRNLTTSNTPD
jgi:hypothetical protein